MFFSFFLKVCALELFNLLILLDYLWPTSMLYCFLFTDAVRMNL